MDLAELRLQDMLPEMKMAIVYLKGWWLPQMEPEVIRSVDEITSTLIFISFFSSLLEH